MSIPFSESPGRHERHYRRRIDNPLFGERAVSRDDAVLLEAQRLDHEELMAFLQRLRQTVQRAVELAPNEGSEVILELKERLDRLYEQSAGLAEDHDANQAAIRELVEVIMRNVERGAAGDPQALDELAQERLAREAHYALLSHPLVADLLHPETAIEAVDLAPTLLTAEEDALAAALQLFDFAQAAELHDAAERCLASCPTRPEGADERLRQIAVRLEALRAEAGIN